MNTPDAVVSSASSISPEAWKRIEAGLLEIDALWHTYPHRDEGAYLTGKRYLCLAYDVFAQELLAGKDSDELLEDTLVKLAYEAVIDHGWARWMVGNLQSNEWCTERLFKHWIAAESLKRAKSHFLAGRIAKWRAEAIRRKLSPRRTPNELLEEFRAREYPNFTHDALAHEMGIERSRYFNLKAGKPVRFDAYVRVADFTKISISNLKPTS
jgi:hypothetical protein